MNRGKRLLIITTGIFAAICTLIVCLNALEIILLDPLEVDTSFQLTAETTTYPTDSYVKFFYHDTSWNMILKDQHPAEVGGKYQWQIIWPVGSLADDTYGVRADWYDVNGTVLGESEIKYVTIGDLPPPPTTPPPTTTPPPPPCISIEFYSKEFEVPYGGGVYHINVGIEDATKRLVFYIRNKGTTSLDYLSILEKYYYEEVQWSLAAYVLEPGMEAMATLSMDGAKIQETTSFTFSIRNGATLLAKIDLVTVKERPDKVTSDDIDPKLDGKKYGIVLDKESKSCVVTIDTTGLSEDEIDSLYLSHRGVTFPITGVSTIIEIECAYGTTEQLALYQRIGNTYQLIHMWFIERIEEILQYDINAQDIDGDGFLEVVDSEGNFEDTLDVMFRKPLKGDLLLMGEGREEFKPNVHAWQYLLSEGKYTLLLEADNYTPVTLTLEVESTVPVTTVPPTAAPTTPPPTSPPTAPPTTPPPSPSSRSYIFGFIAIILILFGAMAYLLHRYEKKKSTKEEKEKKEETGIPPGFESRPEPEKPKKSILTKLSDKIFHTKKSQKSQLTEEEKAVLEQNVKVIRQDLENLKGEKTVPSEYIKDIQMKLVDVEDITLSLDARLERVSEIQELMKKAKTYITR